MGQIKKCCAAVWMNRIRSGWLWQFAVQPGQGRNHCLGAILDREVPAVTHFGRVSGWRTAASLSAEMV